MGVSKFVIADGLELVRNSETFWNDSVHPGANTAQNMVVFWEVMASGIILS